MPTRVLSLALIAGLAAPALTLARPYLVAPVALSIAEPTFPNTPAGKCAKDFLAMVNDPAPDRIKAFESTWASKSRRDRTPIDERITRVKALNEEWGKTSITNITATPAIIVEATTARGLFLSMTFNMSPSEPGKLDGIDVEASTDGAQSHPITTDTLTQTVKGVADSLRKGYVFPDKGAKMADSILAKLKAGDYNDIQSESALAKQLTDDCRAITNDKHLGIRIAPEDKSASHEAMMPSRDEMRRENYAFKKVEVLPGNVGYLRFDAFVEDEQANKTASAAMNFLSNCDSIIFDMRSNGGGSPEMIRYITSYLFDSKTHLNDMVDRDGKIVEEYWTLPEVPGPRPKADLPIFILTSSRTFSGAEEFSYNLKNLKRATLVGETTGGGAHPVRGDRINERFIVRVPFMRAQNPITKTNWEGTGVEPDVKTTSGEALDKAIELARAATKSKK